MLNTKDALTYSPNGLSGKKIKIVKQQWICLGTALPYSSMMLLGYLAAFLGFSVLYTY